MGWNIQWTAKGSELSLYKHSVSTQTPVTGSLGVSTEDIKKDLTVVDGCIHLATQNGLIVPLKMEVQDGFCVVSGGVQIAGGERKRQLMPCTCRNVQAYWGIV